MYFSPLLVVGSYIGNKWDISNLPGSWQGGGGGGGGGIFPPKF